MTTTTSPPPSATTTLRSHPLFEELQKRCSLETVDLDGSLSPLADLPDQVVTLGLLPAAEVLAVLQQVYGRPALVVADYRIPTEVLRLLHDDTCKYLNILPLQVAGDRLLLAMADPWDIDACQYVEMATGLQVEPVACLKHDLVGATAKAYGATEVLSAAIQDLLVDSGTGHRKTGDELLEDEHAPVIKLVNYLLEQGISIRASDIHLEPQERGGKLRYRIDGALHHFPAPPEDMYAAVVSRIKVLSNMDVSESRFPQDGRITRTLGNRTVDFRVSTIPFAHGEGVVMRILDKTGVSVDLDALEFPPNLMEIYTRAAKSPHGLILVSGPTGSGKSTTLYATLSRIATPDRKVITIEDPVEYMLNTVVQSPVREDIGYTFEMGLRAMLRHDPDVIMIGEMRDLTSAEIAVRSALTGHLVLSTIHTNDSVQAITRLIDMGIPDFLVRAVLRLVMAQRLVRRICKPCRRAATVPKADLADMGLDAATLEKLPDDVKVYEAAGCDACKNLGYFGRFAIYEVLDATNLFRNLRTRQPTLQELTELALQLGLQTLRQSGLKRALEGETTIEEILKVTADFS